MCLNSDFDTSITSGDLIEIKLLIDRGVKVNNSYSDPCNNYLKMSVINRQIEVVKLLLDNGAKIHEGNDAALRIAVDEGYLDMVQLLLDYGANPYIIEVWVLDMLERDNINIAEIIKINKDNTTLYTKMKYNLITFMRG